MSSEIKVPTLPESIADALIVTWHKAEGDAVQRDEVLVDIETDKVVMEVPAAQDGVLGKILEPEGTTVTAHQVIGSIEEGSASAAAPETVAAAPVQTAPAAANDTDDGTDGQTSPSVRKLLAEHGLNASDVTGTGKNGRISKEDVEQHVAGKSGAAAGSAAVATSSSSASAAVPETVAGERTERRVPMSRLRSRIAERLLDATQNTAMLTTFNEVNMKAFIDMRKQYKDEFEKSHGIKLGFMSIFLNAMVNSQ